LSEKTITVPISISTTESDCDSDGGCATPDGDYTTIATTAFPDIAAGGTNTTIDVTPTNDDRYEDPQDIVINMGTPTYATESGTQSYTLTINDDVNDKPSAQFFNSLGAAAASEEVTEETGSYTVTVKLDKVSEKTVTIPYTIDFSSNTAIIASDNSDATSTVYPSDWVKWGATDGSTALTFNVTGDGTQTGTGTLTISGAASDATALQSETFLVTINDDAIDENTESIYFTMDAPTNADKGTVKTFRLDITDPADAPVRFSFATASAGTEPSASGAENESPTFMVVLLDPDDQTLLKESGKEITISWTIALDGTNSDAAKDATEAIDFKLPDFDGATSYTANLVFSPRTGSDTAAPTSLTIGTSDIDFEDADVTYESTEYFKLSLAEADGNAVVGNSNGATGEHYYGITNIDSRPVIFLTDSDNGVSIYEKSSQGASAHDFQFEVLSTGIQKSEVPINAYFKVSATASGSDNDADIAYSGTYEAGDLDYTYNSGPLDDNQSVTISAPITGSSTGSITLAAYDDALYEQDETLVLGMYTYDAAQASALSLASESYATAPDGSKVDDTGYDEVELTIIKDPSDKPFVDFVNADGVGISTASFKEDTS
ncbi:uncharacterized protein METZ01_LOCUS189349, partial [marine metagenome]